MSLDNVEALGGEEPVRSYEHVMLDLETLGVRNDAAVLSIGMVCFDPYTGLVDRNASLSIYIDLEDPLLGSMDTSTVMWWLKQSDEARAALFVDERWSVRMACDAVAEMVETFGIKYLWSNGPSFDEVILRSMFARAGKKWPFRYNAGRDFRTMLTLAEANGILLHKSPVAHIAVEDAAAQAAQVCTIWRALRK